MKRTALALVALLATSVSLSAQIPQWMPGADDPELEVAPLPPKVEPLPSDLLYVQMLLMTPADIKEPVPDEEQWPSIRAAFLKVSMDWQILDERECRYYMAKRDDFQGDLTILRNRYQEFKDLPKVEEAGWLPPCDISAKLIAFNRAYKSHLETRLIWESDRADIIRVVIDETEQCYQVWDAIRGARSEWAYVTQRRLSLARAKKLMGEAAYNRFELPEYVPIWRFTPLN